MSVFFVTSPMPIKPKQKINRKSLPKQEIINVTLAPFTENPKLCFEKILVGTSVTQELLLHNTGEHNLEILIKNIPPEEKSLILSWHSQTVPPHSSVPLLISWFPKKEEEWRQTLTLDFGKRLKKDIAISCKSFDLKKPKTKQKQKNGNHRVISSKGKSPKRSSCNLSLRQSKTGTFDKFKRHSHIPSLYNNSIHNKENLNLEETDIPQYKVSFLKNETFTSPSSATFNIQSNSDIRRATYTVNDHVLPKSELHNISNDSLDMSPNVKLNSKQFGRNNSLKESLKQNANLTPNNQMLPNNIQSTVTKEVSATFTLRQDISNSINNGNFNVSIDIPKTSKFTFQMETELVENNCNDLLNITGATYTKSPTILYTDFKDNINFEMNYNNDYDDKVGVHFSPLKNSSLVKEPFLLLKTSPISIINETDESDLNDCWLKSEVAGEFTAFQRKPLKRKSDSVFEISPPKRIHEDIEEKWQSDRTVIEQKKKEEVFILSEYVDPFLTNSFSMNEVWIRKQETDFKKWLNALLTPPMELLSNADAEPIDVAKLWQQCKQKVIPAAPTKETVSNKYHVNHRLDSLRKSAKNLFKSTEITSVVEALTLNINKQRLKIRDDRHIHLDLGLQSEVMLLLLSYNPLWLRIGLETIYNTELIMTSNSDITGLSTFLSQCFFKDQRLLQKHKSVHSPKYNIEFNRFILKKFLTLVYFLDVAKMNVLIAHDPCLFCKKAPIKESREVLLKFSRDLLFAIGDITKHLKLIGYIVNHKQTYIHEFDYKVSHLGVDLRDGVRLTKVMEIILLQKGLTNALRVPPISLLQKIHNMTLVFNALQKANFEIVGDIIPKDIVAGHYEKTFSFLWQIIYKFQAPRFINAAKIIKMWWKSLRIVIKRKILNKNRNRKIFAAQKIQQWYRRHKLAERIETTIIPLLREYIKENKMLKSVVKIQSYFRMHIQRSRYIILKSSTIHIQRYCRNYLINISHKRKKEAVIKIQSFVRMWIAKRNYQKTYLLIIRLQQIYKATKLMKMEQTKFTNLKISSIKVQRRYRANLLMRKDMYDYENKQKAVHYLQNLYRANVLMKVEHEKFRKIKKSAIVIQRWFKATIMMKTDYKDFQKLKFYTCLLQSKYRARQNMKIEYQKYQNLKFATNVIQRQFRGKIAMKKQLESYQNLKRAAIIIQNKFRAKLLMKIEHQEFNKIRNAVLVIQRRFRATQSMKIEYTKYYLLKIATIIVQRHFRALKEMRIQVERYNNLKRATLIIQTRFKANRLMTIQSRKYNEFRSSIIKIQRWFRTTKAMRIQYLKFKILRNASLLLQRRFRANTLMKSQRIFYIELKTSTLIVQRRFRANKSMETEHQKYQNLKKSVIVIQRRFRAQLLMRAQHKSFCKLKDSTLIIQKRFRANKSMVTQYTKYRTLKKYATILQRRFRANKLMKMQYMKYNNLRHSTIIVQRRFKAYLLMKSQFNQFNMLKKSAVIVQIRYQANKMMKMYRFQYQTLRTATMFIQNKFRSNKLMKVQYQQFQDLRKFTILLQRRFKAKKEMRIQQLKYHRLKSTTVLIQRKFRAKRIMKTVFAEFQLLRQATVLIQRRYRANKFMQTQYVKYNKLKNSAIIIQRKFIAYRLMKAQLYKYNTLRKYVILIQTRFKAYQVMKAQRIEYHDLKIATIILQRKFRSHILMRKQYSEYQDLRKFTKLVQQRFRANKAMKIQLERYLKLKDAVILIQRRYRALKLMKKYYNNFQNLKSKTIYLQRRVRATKCMKLQVEIYQNLKRSVITIQNYYKSKRETQNIRMNYINLKICSIKIQRRFRATKDMKLQRAHFTDMKNSAVILQKKFRAFKVMETERESYKALKKATICIQRRFRANILMRTQCQEYQTLRNAALVLQKFYRANKITKLFVKQYNELKIATLIIQNRFRSKLAMKYEHTKYQQLKLASIRIQRRFRSNRDMRIQRRKFNNIKNAAIIIQQIFRAYKVCKHLRTQFVEIKNATIILQRRFRANKSMIIERTHYQLLRKTTIIIQRRFQAILLRRKEQKRYVELRKIVINVQQRFKGNNLMKIEYHKYQTFRKSVINIQQRFRAKKLMRIERNRFLQLRTSTITIQRYCRHWYTTKFTVKRIENTAAVKIQSNWRSYRVRKLHPEVAPIRKNIREINLNALPQATLGQRRTRAIDILVNENSTLLQILQALEDLEYITRRCRNTLIQMSSTLPQQLYLLIKSTNRSPAEIEICTVATSILINFAKYYPTLSSTWIVEQIDDLFTVMNHCCDKEEKLFPYLCTLVWIFLQIKEYKSFICALPQIRHKLQKIYTLCVRKQKMVTHKNSRKESFFVQNNNLIKPLLGPDWGIDYTDRPRTFTNSVFAIECVLCALGLYLS